MEGENRYGDRHDENEDPVEMARNSKEDSKAAFIAEEWGRG